MLIHTQIGTANTLAVNADGGFGDDTLQAGLQLRETVSETLDALTSGTGSDTFLLDLLTDVSADAFDDELIASVRITDFDPALDTLIIQTTNIDQGQASQPVRTVEGFTLFETDDGAFTDVEITFDEAGNDTVQTVRLFGVAGLQDSDLTLVS